MPMVMFSYPYVYVVLASMWLAGTTPDRMAMDIAIETNRALERHAALPREHGVSVGADDVDALARRVAAALAARRGVGAVTECDRALRFCIRVEAGGAN